MTCDLLSSARQWVASASPTSRTTSTRSKGFSMTSAPSHPGGAPPRRSVVRTRTRQPGATRVIRSKNAWLSVSGRRSSARHGRMRLLCRNLGRVSRVGCRQDIISGGREAGREGPPDQRLTIDDQHPIGNFCGHPGIFPTRELRNHVHCSELAPLPDAGARCVLTQSAAMASSV